MDANDTIDWQNYWVFQSESKWRSDPWSWNHVICIQTGGVLGLMDFALTEHLFIVYIFDLYCRVQNLEFNVADFSSFFQHILRILGSDVAGK